MASEGLNRVMLIGNLGADPELKITSGGQARLSMRLATTDRYIDKNGERQERTEWHSVVLWGNRAAALAKFLSKGRTIHVEGRLQTRSWEDDSGIKRSKTEVNAHGILLLGGGRARSTDASGAPAGAAGDQGGSGDDASTEVGDDDLPF